METANAKQKAIRMTINAALADLPGPELEALHTAIRAAASGNVPLEQRKYFAWLNQEIDKALLALTIAETEPVGHASMPGGVERRMTAAANSSRISSPISRLMSRRNV